MNLGATLHLVLQQGWRGHHRPARHAECVQLEVPDRVRALRLGALPPAPVRVDQRTAGYRDLFIHSTASRTSSAGANPWREWNPFSNENQQERWAQVRTGNPDLKPEKSTTLTLGMVLRPGGWAQGMTFSVDYYNIRVKDGIATPFTASTTSVIQSCWQNSGNQDGSLSDPDIQTINGQIDYNFYDAALQRYPVPRNHLRRSVTMAASTCWTS